MGDTMSIVREISIAAKSYEDIIEKITDVKTLSPSYAIVAGTKKGEGAVFEKNAGGEINNLRKLGENNPDDWFLLKCNSDYGEIDHRTSQGEKRMKNIRKRTLSEVYDKVLKLYPNFDLGSARNANTTLFNPNGKKLENLMSVVAWEDPIKRILKKKY